MTDRFNADQLFEIASVFAERAAGYEMRRRSRPEDKDYPVWRDEARAIAEAAVSGKADGPAFVEKMYARYIRAVG